MNSDSVRAGWTLEQSIEDIRPKASPHPFRMFPAESMNLYPNASNIPVPASFVALPPMHIMNLRHPLSNASAISWPVPYVDVRRGSLSSEARRVSPLALAISMTAVEPSIQAYSASTGLPSGSLTMSLTGLPPNVVMSASMLPSPPSATASFTTSQPGIASWIPFSTASATCHEDRQPLNESEATTTLHMIDKISTNIILILIP